MIKVNSLNVLKTIRDNLEIKFNNTGVKLLKRETFLELTSLSLIRYENNTILRRGLFCCYNRNFITKDNNISIGSNWYSDNICILDMVTKDIQIHNKDKDTSNYVQDTLKIYDKHDDIDVLLDSLEYNFANTLLTEEEYEFIYT